MKRKSELNEMKKAEVIEYALSLQTQIERSSRIEKSVNPANFRVGFSIGPGRNVYGTKEAIDQLRSML